MGKRQPRSYERGYILSFVALALWLVATEPARSAQLYMEEFPTGVAGWGTRDGEMTVSHGGVGNEWLVGSFAASFLPQSDAFRIATGLNFLGDYVQVPPNASQYLTQIRFDLYAVNVLPGDLFIRLIDGANTFTYQFAPLPGALLGGWQTFTVNLAWSFGWSGVDEAAFNSALTSVDAIEIQLSRSGNLAQNYYLDNVQTLNTPIGGGGGPGVIPEPSTVSLLVSALFVIAMDRRRRLSRA